VNLDILKGRVAVVTGASSGIGEACALGYAEAGAKVVMAARRAERLDALVAKIEAAGGEAIGVVTDVTSEDAVANLFRQAVDRFGTVDVLINNAGVAQSIPIEDCTLEQNNIRDIFDTNFFGAIRVTQRFLPMLMKSASPSIINVSSELGSLAIQSVNTNANRAKYHAYGASKTALNAFTMMLANELRERNICVNCVTPGYTATDLNSFQGTKSVQEGAKAIVQLAASGDRTLTGKFIIEHGEVTW